MKLKRLLSILLVLGIVLTVIPCLLLNAQEEGESEMKLWYDEPASKGKNILDASVNENNTWQQHTLPIGNGDMGANVYGEIASEHLTFNEKTLWTGGPSESRPDYNGGNLVEKGNYGETMKEVQALFAAGKTAEAQALAGTLIGANNDGYGYYQAWGDIYFDYADITEANATGYERELDLTTAVSSVKFTEDGTDYQREFFISHPDNVLVGRLTAEGSATLNLDVRFTSKQGAVAVASGNTLELCGEVSDNQMQFASYLTVVNEGGTVTANGDKLTVSGATAITVYVSAATDYKDEYPEYRTGEDMATLKARVLADVTAASQKKYDDVKADHIADYQSLYNRMTLDLGQVSTEKTTDELLAAYNNGTASDGERRLLEVLLFQYGRYMTIAASREDSQLPTNLQGVWNNQNNPPWHGDYHMDVNLQMNYWPTYVTNLAECAKPLVQYVDSLRAPGRVTANIYAGVESTNENPENGFMAHTQNTPFGWTCPGWDFRWGWTSVSVPWILQNCWEYYEYTGDVEYLRNEIYPIMREATLFYDQTLVRDADGYLVSSPTTSPEHGPRTNGNTFEQVLIWQLYEDTIKAAEILKVDADKVAEWKETQGDLRLIEIGTDGQIKEWYEETSLNSVQADASNHRHLSHMLGLFPGDLVQTNDAWIDAALVSMEDRIDECTGWGLAQRINTWARLRDGEKVYSLIGMLFNTGIYPNLWDTCPPFQVDGNFGYTSGVAEMLMQSNMGYIDLLPALPDAWEEGSFDGMVARGNFEISMEWNNKRVLSATVLSNNGGTATIQADAISGARVTDSNGKAVAVTKLADNRISFETVAGESYTISEIPEKKDAPVGLTVSRMDENAVALTWSAVAGTNVTYNVYREFEGQDLALVASNLTDVSYVDIAAPDYLGSVSYRVSATVNGDESALSAKVTEERLAKEGMIDGKDDLVTYVGSWTLYAGNANNYGGTLNYADATLDNTATASLKFVGTGVQIYTMMNNYYSAMYEVFIDGVSYGKVDTYSKTTTQKAISFSYDGLAYGVHTVVVKPLAERNSANTSADKAGNYKVELDAFNILNSYASAGVLVDGTDSLIRYTGSWNMYAKATTSYGNTLSIADATLDATATASMNFVGTGIEIYAFKNSYYSAMFEVLIDGVSYGKVDTYSKTTAPKSVCFSVNNLEYGHHVVTVKPLAERNSANTSADKAGNYKIELDAFKVLDSDVGSASPLVGKAALAELKNVSKKATDHGVHLDFGNLVSDASVTYTLNVEQAGTYYLGIGYLVGSNTTRVLNLSVNGGATQTISFARNGSSWNDPCTNQFVVVNLTRGQNTLTFALNGTNNGPIISDIVAWKQNLLHTSADIPTLSGTVTKKDYPSGLDGVGYLLGEDGTVSWTMSIPQSGNYKVLVAYSAVSGNGEISVSVNGTKKSTILAAPSSTTLGNSWEFVSSQEIPFTAGDATITISCPSGDAVIGGIYLDQYFIAHVENCYSSDYDGANGLATLFDGNTSTFWYSARNAPSGYAPQFPIDIVMKYSEAHDVSGYKFVNGSDSARYGRSPSAWKLYGSDNGTDWEEIHSVTSATVANGQEVSYILNKVVHYKWYKFSVLSINGGHATQSLGIKLSELELTSDTILEDAYAENCSTGGSYIYKGKEYGVPALFDDDTGTFWFSEASSSITGTFPVPLTLRYSGEYPVFSYSMTTNNAYGRSPTAWTLYGSNDGVNWTEVDRVSDYHFTSTLQAHTFSLDKVALYTYYKFNFEAIEGGNAQARGVALYELDLLNVPVSEEALNMVYGDYVAVAPSSMTVTLPAGQSVAEIVTLQGMKYVRAIGVGSTTVTVGTATRDIVVEKAKINLVLVSGQSNAAGGYGKAGNVFAPEYGDGFLWNGSALVDLKTYADAITTKSVGWHPALAREWFALTGEKTVIVQRCHPGKSISLWADFNTGAITSTTTAIVDLVESCLTALENNPNVELVRTGYYWLQGEDDAYTDLAARPYPTAKQYETAYLGMHEAFKSALTVDGVAEPYGAIISCRTRYGIEQFKAIESCSMRAAQQYLANTYEDIYLASVIADSWTSGKISFTSKAGDTIVTNGTDAGANNIHYNQAGYSIIGMDAADNMYEALIENVKVTDFEMIGHDGFTKYEDGAVINVDDNRRFLGVYNLAYDAGMAQLIVRPLPVGASDAQVQFAVTDKNGNPVAGVIDEYGHINIRKVTEELTLTVTVGTVTKTYTLTGSYATHQVIDFDNENIKYVGRWEKLTDRARGYWSGTYFEVNFTGSQFILYVGDFGSFSVVVDGKAAQQMAPVNGVLDLSGLLDSQKSTHTVRVATADDTVDYLQVQDVLIAKDGTLLEPTKKLLIEVVGDSITAGAYYAPQSANTYAFTLAGLLDVDYVPVSLGGIALTDGSNGNRGTGICTPSTAAMNERYFWTKPLDRHTENSEWDFSAYTPDLILINLGTNDNIKGVSDEVFTETYVKFIQDIRAKRGSSVKIVMLIPLQGFKKDAIVAAYNQLNDENLYLVDATNYLTDASDFAGNGNVHPSVAGHQEFGEKLAEELRPILFAAPEKDPNVAYAEDAIPDGEVSKLTNGNKITYFDFGNSKTGQSVTYTLHVDKAGVYYVGILYCTGSGTDRRLQVSVNGVVSQEVTFPRNSNKWGENIASQFTYQKIFLALEEGENTITLAQFGSYSAPQISDIVIYPEYVVQNDVTINLSATLTDRVLNAGEITFTLTDGTNTYTATNDENGNAVIVIPAAEVRMGTFTLSQSTTVENVTLADAQTVTITLSDNGIGGITATASDVAPFENTYVAPNADVTLSATVNGKDADVQLIDQDGNVIETVTSINGTATFTTLKLEDGVYTYIVKQNAQNGNGWFYDTSEKTITVTVANGEATIDGEAVFTNTYDYIVDTDVTINVNVKVEDITMKEGYVNVTLTKDGEVISTAVVDASGKAVLTIPASKDMAGVYTITATATFNGITLSDAQTVTVTVADDGDGVANVTASASEVSFSGIYIVPFVEGEIKDGKYLVNGKGKEMGLFKHTDGNYYYAGPNGKLIAGQKYFAWRTNENCDLPEDWYFFDADGKMYQGIYEHPEKGGLYYFLNGKVKEMGLFKYSDGNYYVSQWDGKIITSENYTAYGPGKYYVWKIHESASDIATDWYFFGKDGAMLQGICEHPTKGGLYYFVNGKVKEMGLFKYSDGKYYISQWDGKIITSENYTAYGPGKYYVWKIHESASDITVGWYYFGQDGAMLQGIHMHPEKNDWYYFYNGQVKEMGLFKYTDGNYYYAQAGGKLVTSENYTQYGAGKYYVWKLHESASDMAKGWYFFDETGKMIVK